MKKQLNVFNFQIQNAGADTLEIHIDGSIVDASTQQIMKDWWGDETSVSFKSFRDQVNASDARVINIFINSPGGHVGDAMAIHDLIVDLQAKGKTVNTKGRGIVASAATYILMAGNSSEMSKNSWFMIHNASGYAFGTVDEVENQARTLRKFNDAIRDFYASATGLRKEDISKLMNAETWLTAEEAKEKGFVKSITGETAFQNSIPADNWQYSNMAVLNAYNQNVKPPRQEDANTFIENQFTDMKKYFTEIINQIRGVKPAEGATQQEIVNQIADAMQAPLERVGGEIETTITNQVGEVLKGEAVTAAINSAVNAATETLTNRITELEKINKELETNVTNFIGKPTSTGNAATDGVKPIGEWRD